MSKKLVIESVPSYCRELKDDESIDPKMIKEFVKQYLIDEEGVNESELEFPWIRSEDLDGKRFYSVGSNQPTKEGEPRYIGMGNRMYRFVYVEVIG